MGKETTQLSISWMLFHPQPSDLITPFYYSFVRHGSRGVMSWTFYLVLAQGRGFIPYLGVSSAAIPLYKVLTSLRRWNFKQEVPCLCTLHTRKFLFFFKKSWPLWPVMMDDSVPTHERRKLVTTY